MGTRIWLTLTFPYHTEALKRIHLLFPLLRNHSAYKHLRARRPDLLFPLLRLLLLLHHFRLPRAESLI